MGADMKSLRLRMRSVDSTLHLTTAMGLVASSKIRRANEAMKAARDYAEAYENIISALVSDPLCKTHPYLRSSGSRTRILVIAGDRGMAGGYNANVFRLMRTYPDAEIVPIGKRACERFGKDVVSSEVFPAQQAIALAKELCADFTDGKFDRLGIVSTEYVSMMTQTAKIEWVLPFTPGKTAETLTFEPEASEILSVAVPGYLAGKISAAVRESFACEVAARRTAMDSAGKNAQAMLDSLQLSYNRARQGSITQEITEIVAGSGN